MATPLPEESSPNQLPDVPWTDVVRFVRQLSHDLRNHLNAAELQSAYIGEIATDSEIKDEVKRLRSMLGELSTVLQKLSADMAPPRPSLIPYKAADLLEDLRRRMDAVEPKGKAATDWDVRVKDATVNIDPQLFPLAVQELVANAVRHGGDRPFRISASIDARKQLVITLLEPKEGFQFPTENWGRRPLRDIGQGHYGLGLNRARTIVEAHGGQLHAHYDKGAKMLVTTISLSINGGNP